MLDQDIMIKLREILLERRRQLVDIRQSTRSSLEFLHTPEIEPEETAAKQTLSQGMEQRANLELQEIQAIDAALSKIEDGTYGNCDICGKPISVKRLHAMPWVATCIRCARQRESFEPGEPIGEVERDEIEDLSDQDIEQMIWDAIDAEEDLQTNDLEISSSTGTIHLTGSLPDKTQRQRIREIIQDQLGFDDVVEHIEISDPGRDKFAGPREPGEQEQEQRENMLRGEPAETDPYASINEDKPMMPPDRPEWENKP
jgi:DnaK suppressor protein